MPYSKYIPYPRAFLKSVELLFYNVPVLLIADMFSTYYEILSSFFIREENLVLFLLGYIFLSLLTLWLGFAYTYHLFWGKPDPNPQHLKWLPSNQSLAEGFLMLIFSLIGYLIVIISLIPFIYNDLYYIHSDLFRSLSCVFWVTVIAYCYQYKILIARSRHKKKHRKA